ncbi:MAG: DUF2891 family protein [Myxococcota bacterium]
MAQPLLSPVFARRIARVALQGIERAWPYQPQHRWQGPDDGVPPSELHPIFWGCYDWHSAVHAHWALARSCNQHLLDPATRRDAMTLLTTTFTDDRVAVEAAYFDRQPGFEWPYGWAWLLALTAELQGSDDDTLKAAGETLRPLATKLVARIEPRLAGQIRPIRVGTHRNSAFAMELFWDAAVSCGHPELRETVAEHGARFFDGDVAYPWAYEPSAYDFLSPGLATIGLQRRLLSPDRFDAWLAAFGAPDDAALSPIHELDPSDGWLAHLVGLDLSRAWELRGLAAHRPDDPRAAVWLGQAHAHRLAANAALFSGHYAGDHWLGTFALYGAGAISA